MKIKRLCAPNIREAMRQVRDELGAEAVILSNRRVASGVEIVAAVDYDEHLVDEEEPSTPEKAAVATAAVATVAVATTAGKAAGKAAMGKPAVATAEAPMPPGLARAYAAPEAEPRGFAEAVRGIAEHRAQQAPSRRPAEASAQTNHPKSPPAARPTDTGKPKVVWSQDPMLVEMQSQIRAMYGLLTQQVSGLAWGELGRRQPQRADLLQRLLEYGLPSELCLRLADAVMEEQDLETAWNKSLTLLAQGLSNTGDDILTHGGVVALVGPTGVGKTTTVAKLAARYALRHGPRRVALITTDSYRIGAFDQLRTFGMILDMPVRLAGNAEELAAALEDFADRELVLIDTAGMSQRDLRLTQQFALLDKAPGLKSYLVLTANAQTSALEEAVAAFAQTELSGCILTKLDETSRLGGALAVVHDRGLPLAYVGNGQRVPEDLQEARAEALVQLGAELVEGRTEAPVDETLAVIFGGRVANAGI